METTAAKVIEIITELMDCLHEIKPTDKLSEDLGMDSMDRSTLVFELETEFETEIDGETAEGWQTVQDVITTVEQRGE